MSKDPPIGFIRYAHRGDEARVTDLREHLERELSQQLGTPAHLVTAGPGEPPTRAAPGAILIPLLTPAFFDDADCRATVAAFLAPSTPDGHDPLVFPVHYVTAGPVAAAGAPSGDPVTRWLQEHTFVDWRELRRSGLDTEPGRQAVTAFAATIAPRLTPTPGPVLAVTVPTPTDVLADHVPLDETASVVGLIERRGNQVFVIPERFVRKPGDELPFHNVGGKRQPDEGWIEALQREATEEIGVRLSVKSAAVTRQVTTAAELDEVYLADDPRPYCIYKRTRAVDPQVPEPSVTWIVGYEAEITDTAAVEPQSEIAAVLILTPDVVRRTAQERMTYADIARAGDGSEVIVRAEASFDWDRVAVPTGLAAISVLR